MGTDWFVFVGGVAIAGPFSDNNDYGAKMAADIYRQKYGLDTRVVFFPNNRGQAQNEAEVNATQELFAMFEYFHAEAKANPEYPLLAKLGELQAQPINPDLVYYGEQIVAATAPVGPGLGVIFGWAGKAGAKAFGFLGRFAPAAVSTAFRSGGRYAGELLASAIELIPGQLEQQAALRLAAARTAVQSERAAKAAFGSKVLRLSPEIEANVNNVTVGNKIPASIPGGEMNALPPKFHGPGMKLPQGNAGGVPKWKQYELQNGGRQTTMQTTFRGRDVTVRLDSPPTDSQIIDFKDYNWTNPKYQDPFMQSVVTRDFQTQILKYKTIRPNVHFQFSQEPPLWVGHAIDEAGGTFSVIP